jgi:hypothetical protein
MEKSISSGWINQIFLSTLVFEALLSYWYPFYITLKKKRGGRMFWFLKQMFYVFMVSAVFILCSCAGGGQQKSETTMETVHNNAVPLTQKFDNVVFSKIQTTDTIRKDYPDSLEQFELAMISYLRKKNVFTEVDQDTGSILDGATLRVEPTIDDMRITSSGARIWGGAFAGSSNMVVTVKLVDVATGKCLRTKTISSHNNAFAAAWTGGGSDKSLPMDMGKVIGEYLYTVVPTPTTR